MKKEDFLTAMKLGKNVYAIDNYNDTEWYIHPTDKYGAEITMYIKIKNETKNNIYQALYNKLSRLSAYDIIKSIDINWEILNV